MKLGLQINRFTWPGEPHTISDTLATIATTADKAGFYSLWVMDHFFQIMYVGESHEPMLESYTTLGFLAGVTKKVKLGTMVTGVIYRHPALLIKAVTTLDVLSKGRAYLGIGAAWNEEESRALGFHFPPVAERFERLEETLQIAHQMWDKETKPYKGKHFDLPNPMNNPRPISKPHPPILIGGGGEKKTLKFVAKYADACNLFDDPELEHKLDVLKEHCKAVSRDYDDIEKTVMYFPPKLNPKAFIKECQRLKKLGVHQVITGISNIQDIKPIEVFGKEIIPEVEKL